MGIPPVPPWEPIADWLCRLDDGDHGRATRSEIREYHEAEAKAIAYDIAVESAGDDLRCVDCGEDAIGIFDGRPFCQTHASVRNIAD